MTATTIPGQVAELLMTRVESLSLTPSVDLFFPGISNDPDGDTTYLEVVHMPNQSNTRALGDDDDVMLMGYLQIAVMYPKANVNFAPGIIAPSDICGNIISHFKKGTNLSGSLITVSIIKQPWMTQGYKDGDRMRYPVSIPYVGFAPAS